MSKDIGMLDVVEIAPSIPPLPSNTILMVEVGSGAHGTGRPGQDDHDEAAIVVETQEQIFNPVNTRGMRTVMYRTQPEGSRSGPGDTDRTLYSLRTYLKLATDGNPSIIMDTYAPVLLNSLEGQRLRDLAPSFIGRHVIPRYRGYMQGQGLRLLGLKGNGHGKRGGGGREELISEYGYDTKYAMHCARLGFQCIELLTTGKLELPIQGWPGEWLKEVRYGGIPFQEWWDQCLWLDARMESLQENESVPPGPDYLKITQESIIIHQMVWEHGVRLWDNGHHRDS